MPRVNEKDLRDVPDEAKRAITFTFVSTMDEVLRIALMSPVADDALAGAASVQAAAPESEAVVPVTSEITKPGA